MNTTDLDKAIQWFLSTFTVDSAAGDLTQQEFTVSVDKLLIPVIVPGHLLEAPEVGETLELFGFDVRKDIRERVTYFFSNLSQKRVIPIAVFRRDSDMIVDAVTFEKRSRYLLIAGGGTASEAIADVYLACLAKAIPEIQTRPQFGKVLQEIKYWHKSPTSVYGFDLQSIDTKLDEKPLTLDVREVIAKVHRRGRGWDSL